MPITKGSGAYRTPGKKIITLELPTQTIKDLDKRVQARNRGGVQRLAVTRSAMIRNIIHDWLDSNRPRKELSS